MEIKICGLMRPEDVESVNLARPDYAGFIIDVPGRRRSLTPSEAAVLRSRLDPGIRAVGVFVDADPALPVRLANEGVIDVIQLHGEEDEAYIRRLRRAAPDAVIWRAFQVKGPADVEEAAACSADGLVLDSGQGSGRPFDWAVLGSMTRPFLLAGGLDAGRIAAARALPALQGVDLSSGVETEGHKDREKIRAAVAAARKE